MAIVTVQIADFQPTGIVLKDAGFQLHGGNPGRSIGSGDIPERGCGVTLRRFFGGGKLLLAESYGISIIHIGGRDEGTVVSGVLDGIVSRSLVPYRSAMGAEAARARASTPIPPVVPEAGAIATTHGRRVGVLGVSRSCEEQKADEQEAGFHGCLRGWSPIVEKRSFENP
jgi:hypothetical protein